jgi:N6-adenosine-specific RNA methylase IME4
MDTKNNKLVNINTEEYQYLIDDCRSIIGQRIKNSRMEVITAYAEVGERIVNDKLYKKSGKGNQIFLDKLFEDVGIGKTNGYYAINFYEKYFQGKVKDVSTGVETIMMANFEKEGENISWNKIKTLYLPEPKKTETPELPKGKYQVIYADPPWQYAQEQHTHEKQNTTLETHYPTMPTEEIAKLPISDLVGENAVLFMWTTSPKLFECKQVIDGWGFDYKSSMVWDKVLHNVGYYVSVRHEFLLICTKGSCLPDNPKLHDSVITEERTEHSRKPEIFYEIIEDMYKGKKIELFARKKRVGWDTWGNQL